MTAKELKELLDKSPDDYEMKIWDRSYGYTDPDEPVEEQSEGKKIIVLY